MSLGIIFRPQAAAEVRNARASYEGHRAGLGAEFVAELDGLVERIAREPKAFPRVHGPMRRALFRRFPYAVYFAIVESDAVVFAVLHGHRHPDAWRHRR
jgi:plasmid stabilization system protein ParE